MAEVKHSSSSQIVDEIPKKTSNSNAQIVSNWSKFKKAIQAVFYFKVQFQTLVTVPDLKPTISDMWFPGENQKMLKMKL